MGGPASTEPSWVTTHTITSFDEDLDLFIAIWCTLTDRKFALSRPHWLHGNLSPNNVHFVRKFKKRTRNLDIHYAEVRSVYQMFKIFSKYSYHFLQFFLLSFRESNDPFLGYLKFSHISLIPCSFFCFFFFFSLFQFFFISGSFYWYMIKFTSHTAMANRLLIVSSVFFISDIFYPGNLFRTFFF